MTYVFESKKPRIFFEVEGSKKNALGHVTKKGRSIEFRGHYFATDDERVAKAIMDSSMFSNEQESGEIWLRIKSEDEKEVQKAQQKKKAGRRVVHGAAGTSQER